MSCARGEGRNLHNRSPLTPCTVSTLVPRNPRHCNPSTSIRHPPHVTGRPQAAHVMAEAAESTNSEYSPGIRRPLGFADTAPSISTARPPCGTGPLGSAIPRRPTAQSPTTARPPRADGRARIAGRRSPRRESRGVDPGTPALPNPRGAPLAMAATCRPVLRRPNWLPLVPISTPCHPSAGAIHSPSIPGDADAPRSHFLDGLPGRGRERSLTPKGHTSESGGEGGVVRSTPLLRNQLMRTAEARSARQTFKQEHSYIRSHGFVPNPRDTPQGVA